MSKFLPHEDKYLSQFNDNPNCVRARQMAVTQLDKDDDAGVNLLRRVAYVTATAAQCVDDDVFICAMLHPLAEYRKEDLPVLMTGLGYEALKVVEALRETQDLSAMYLRVSTLESKYKAIVMARVMWRLMHIEIYEYPEAQSILDEAEEYTSKLDVPLDLMVQFNALYEHAVRVLNDIFLEEILDDEEEEAMILANSLGSTCESAEGLSDMEYNQEMVAHKRLADELSVVHNQVVTIPGIGKVTYYNGAGFCDDNGELVLLSKPAPEETTKTKKEAPLGTKKINMMSEEYDYEVLLHTKIAKSLGVVMDNQVLQLGVFGTVVYSQGIGFFNKDAEMIKLAGSVFERIVGPLPITEDVANNGASEDTGVNLEETKKVLELEGHHRLAKLVNIKDGGSVTIAGVGEVTYSSKDGFTDKNGTLVNMDENLTGGTSGKL